MRIFEAATIFMALVIFWMFVTERMRCFTAPHKPEHLSTPRTHVLPLHFLRARLASPVHLPHLALLEGATEY